MNWPLAISVAYLAVGGGLTLIGVRLTLSQLSMRTFKTPIPGLSAKPLVMGLGCLAVGAVMLMTTRRLVDWLAGG